MYWGSRKENRKDSRAEKKKNIPFFLILLLLSGEYVFAQAQDDQTDIVLWDGLEQRSNWNVNGENKISLSTEYVTQGRNSLKVDSGDKAAPGAIILKKANTFLDLDTAKKIVFDIYNSGLPCQAALALYLDQRYESVPKEIKSGLNKNITFELNAKDFKFILGLQHIAQAIEFIIYPTNQVINPLYLDNVRIRELAGLESLPPGISPTLVGSVAEGFTPPQSSPSPEYAYNMLPSFRPTGPPIHESKTLFLFGVGLTALIFYNKKNPRSNHNA